MTERKSIDIFLLCFLAMLGLWFFNNGIFSNENYDLNEHLLGRYPTDPGLSSLGQDYAYPWNSASAFLDPNAGVYPNPNCYVPSKVPCHLSAIVPFNAVVFAAFTQISFYESYRVYLIFLLVLWGVGVYVLSKFRPFSVAHVALLLSVILLSSPFHFEFERGNWHSLAFLLMLFSFYSVTKNNDVISSAFFVSLAMFVKLHPGLLIVYYAVRGQVRLVIYAALFSLIFLMMSGGVPVYKYYIEILQGFQSTDILGWANHSTASALHTLLSMGDEPGSRLLLASIVSSVLIGVAMLSFFLLRKQSGNDLVARLELSIILVIATTVPAVAMQYSLVFMVFVLTTLAAALDDAAVRKRLRRAWMPFAWVAAFLANFVIMSPIARGGGEHNFIAHALTPWALEVLRNPWVPLMLVLIILFFLYWIVARAGVDAQVSANPFVRWYQADMAAMVETVRRLRIRVTLGAVRQLLDPVSEFRAVSVLVTRSAVLLALIYLIYFAMQGSILLRL